MQILEQLGSGEGMPVDAISAATADRATVAPLLIDAIDRYEPENEAEENGLFVAFHLLGQWQEKPAYRVLARFLRRPDVESILGDATTETSHKVMANVFDGNPGPVYDIIHDSDADEFVRNRMFDTLVMLVFQGKLDRSEVADFLRSAFADLQPQDQCAVWDGWQLRRRNGSRSLAERAGPRQAMETGQARQHVADASNSGWPRQPANAAD